MNRILALLPLVLVAGCLTEAPRPATVWSLVWQPPAGLRAAEKPHVDQPVRIGGVQVAPPCAGVSVTVERADLSVAFDGFNAFAAPPAALVPAIAARAMQAVNYCPEVVETSSAAQTELTLEIQVRQLALVCGAGESREAVARVATRLLKGRRVLETHTGEGRAPFASGSLGEIFSKALSEALVNAL